MNRNATEKPNSELDELYREAGDIGPDPGIDRIIRARAEQAATIPRPRRTAWLGGLATASVAVAVVAVVLQQAPGPESQPEAAPAEAVRRMEPSGISSDAAEPAAAEAVRPGNVPARDVITTTERRALAAPASPESESVIVTGSRLREAAPSEAQSKTMTDDALFEQLRALIDADRMDEARRLLEYNRELRPDIELPPDIREVLQVQPR